jgi:DNA gyrase subunit B
MPSKLWDCSSKQAADTEIYLVEGDSAAGPAKQGRDSKIQAILPLRGKLLNVEKVRMDRMLGNEELKSIIAAIGCGIGKDFNIKKRRYDKVIIMTDADVDGSHIRTLLLTFFFKYMRPLVENGNVYIAQAPLYHVKTKGSGNTGKYLISDVELSEYNEPIKKKVLKQLREEKDKNKIEYTEESLEKEASQKVQERTVMKRFKGLGEMNADELWDTTMNPEARMLQRVKITEADPEEDSLQYEVDVESANRLFRVLMGDNVEERRKYIFKHAPEVVNLDV